MLCSDVVYATSRATFEPWLYHTLPLCDLETMNQKLCTSLHPLTQPTEAAELGCCEDQLMLCVVLF